LLFHRGRSHGCQGNDSFAVFGFLAFLLALVDLYLELQAAGGRKKREISGRNRFEVRQNISRFHARNEFDVYQNKSLDGARNRFEVEERFLHFPTMTNNSNSSQSMFVIQVIVESSSIKFESCYIQGCQPFWQVGQIQEQKSSEGQNLVQIGLGGPNF
jgi:hypothetical protein